MDREKAAFISNTEWVKNGTLMIRFSIHQHMGRGSSPYDLSASHTARPQKTGISGLWKRWMIRFWSSGIWSTIQSKGCQEHGTTTMIIEMTISGMMIQSTIAVIMRVVITVAKMT